ncbi:hypothetical protein ACJMK2_029403 [Sinanodonta woodiana]|uniref:Uncharacterized protein n=1 Tax=Sinanodonta woodiana TaxID=1069815 RepID=A0ABD3XBJ2_SINWO
MSAMRIYTAVLLIGITNVGNVKGLQWCLDGTSMKEYTQDKFCCGMQLLDKFDDFARERSCCSNIIYYTATHYCINGKLESLAPPESLTAALTQPLDETTTTKMAKMTTTTKKTKMAKKADMVKDVCEKAVVYMLRETKKTNKTCQHIWTVKILNMTQLKETGKVKWMTLKETTIKMDESLSRKYKGKTIFVYSDKNLLKGISLELPLGNIIMKDKFRMKHIRRCNII